MNGIVSKIDELSALELDAFKCAINKCMVHVYFDKWKIKANEAKIIQLIRIRNELIAISGIDVIGGQKFQRVE